MHSFQTIFIKIIIFLKLFFDTLQNIEQKTMCTH